MTIFAPDKVENIVGIGENAGFQHFLLVPQCFKNSSAFRLLKVGIVYCDHVLSSIPYSDAI